MGVWCDQRDLSPGALVPLRQCWELARRWYPGRDQEHWVRPSRAEIQNIFLDVGLTGPFWEV